MMHLSMVGPSRLALVRGDITEQRVAAIVNAANSSLLGGGGVDGAIHRRGGPIILEQCKELRRTRFPNGLPPGDAVATDAGSLPADRVIHTVGPVWRGGSANEDSVLANAYRSVLAVAREENLRTVAFPSISTGAYGFPIERAARIALAAVADELRSTPDAFDEVRFVLFSTEDLEVYAATLERL